jgi:nucleotide-binding universal stress UspA family protein
MPASVHPTALGIVLAVLVAVLVGGGLWWMLHPPAHMRGAGLAQTPDESPTVLVPVTRNTSDEVLRLASLIAAQDHTDVTLLHVVEMPYTLPIDAEPLSEDQRAERGVAFFQQQRKVFDEAGIPVTCKVARGRRAGKAIVDWALATRPHAVVLGLIPKQRGVLGGTTSYVLENAGSLRVIVYKGSGDLQAARA